MQTVPRKRPERLRVGELAREWGQHHLAQGGALGGRTAIRWRPERLRVGDGTSGMRAAPLKLLGDNGFAFSGRSFPIRL